MNINVCDVLIKTTRRPRVYTRGFDTDLGLRLSINKFVLKLLIRTLLQYYVDIELLCGTDYINEYVDHRMTINRLCFLNTTLCCYCFFFFFCIWDSSMSIQSISTYQWYAGKYSVAATDQHTYNMASSRPLLNVDNGKRYSI